MRSIINWRVFLILLFLSVLSVFAVFPYVLTLQGDIIKQAGIPISTLIIAQLIQSTILFSFSIFLGLFLAKKIDFHLPVLEAWAAKKDYKKLIQNMLPFSLLLGVITALVIYVVDYGFAIQGSEISTSQHMTPVWQTMLASFYGGITEEVLLRLFIMTLFIWLGMKISKQKKPTPAIILPSILLSAIIFGLGHLPITASLTTITPVIILRAIVLNGIGGVIFGWLYWKKGLESAMLAHFTTDIVLLTVLPLLVGT